MYLKKTIYIKKKKISIKLDGYMFPEFIMVVYDLKYEKTAISFMYDYSYV